MPALHRRAFLASTSPTLLALTGCAAPIAGSTPAHWVSVYLGERDETHAVTVLVTNTDGENLFEKDYQLSDSNEADEDAPFPASTDPDTVVVTVDGTRFERDWPGFEQPALPCHEPNRAGIELWIEDGEDGAPSVRLTADCQRVTMD